MEERELGLEEYELEESELMEQESEEQESETGVEVIPESVIRKAEVCRKKIEEGIKNIGVGFYDVAVGLHEAYTSNYIQIWGYNKLDEYAEKVLGIKRRKAYYLKEIGEKIIKAGLTRDRVERIGWTKLAVISALLEDGEPTTNETLLQQAEVSTVKDLEEAVKQRTAEDSEAKVTKREQESAKPATLYLRNVKLTGDSAKIVEDALTAAYGAIGSEDIGAALSHICAEWLLVRNDGEVETSIDDWITYLERTYGVRLVYESQDDGSPDGIDADLEDLLNG